MENDWRRREFKKLFFTHQIISLCLISLPASIYWLKTISETGNPINLPLSVTAIMSYTIGRILGRATTERAVDRGFTEINPNYSESPTAKELYRRSALYTDITAIFLSGTLPFIGFTLAAQSLLDAFHNVRELRNK